MIGSLFAVLFFLESWVTYPSLWHLCTVSTHWNVPALFQPSPDMARLIGGYVLVRRLSSVHCHIALSAQCVRVYLCVVFLHRVSPPYLFHRCFAHGRPSGSAQSCGVGTTHSERRWSAGHWKGRSTTSKQRQSEADDSPQSARAVQEGE